MLNQLTKLCGVIALALIATACNGVSEILNSAPPPSAPTIAPAPTDAPTPVAAPDASSRPPLGNAPNANIQGALKNLGLTAGVVRASDASGLAIRTPKGNTTVRVDSATIIVIPGKTNPQATDIQTGDRVLMKADDSNSIASLVMVLPRGYTMDNLVLGAAQSSANGSLTVRTRSGSEQISTTASTVVVKNNAGQPALGTVSDLKPGNVIAVIGESKDTAQVIVILKDDLRGALNRGGQPAPPKGKQPLPKPTPGSGG